MPDNNKIGWSNADVRCPFYISHDRAGRAVCCEGFAEGMISTNRFSAIRARDRHMGCFCVTSFDSCPMYRIIYQGKYSGEDA